MAFEIWKDGKIRYVERDAKGRFQHWETIKEPVYEIPREIKEKRGRLNLDYDIRFKIAYESKKPNHSRWGAIAGRIISTFQMDDHELINHLIEEVQSTKETWLNYAGYNKVFDIHIYSKFTTEQIPWDYKIVRVIFEDLGGWGK